MGGPFLAAGSQLHTMYFAKLIHQYEPGHDHLTGLDEPSSPFNKVLFFQRRRPPYNPAAD